MLKLLENALSTLQVLSANGRNLSFCLLILGSNIDSPRAPKQNTDLTQGLDCASNAWLSARRAMSHFQSMYERCPHASPNKHRQL